MSFAADMQAFANTFNATYKNFKETGADEYNRARADEIWSGIAQRQGATAARAAGAAGDPNAMTAVHGVDTGDTSTDSRAREMDRFSKFKTGEAGDFDTAVRTVYGEAAGEGDTGQKAVAATLANRAKASGRSIREEALRTGQYEPWMNRTARARMLALDPNSETYKRIASNVSAALAGDDPTGGATHFFAPRAQAALGRAPPSWALGQRPVTINNHNFYKLPYSGQGQHGLATRRVRTIRVDPEGNPIGPQAALDLEEDPTVYAAKGGVIPSYDTTQMENAGSNPVTRDVLDEGADDDRSDLINVDGARAAVAGGLRFGQRLLGLETHHAAIPDAAPLNPHGVRALTVNATAASPEDMATIHKTVDPQGKMPPELREIAGYNAERLYWMAQGEPQKADAMAWAMLGASKRAASQYGAVALATEDPKKRAEVIAQAYNHLIPDGNTMKITGGGKDGVNFAVHDAQGRVTEKGALAMDDMIQMATGMVNGTQWLQSMVKFATSAPTAAEKKAESESKAAAEFDASLDPKQRDEYRQSLSEDQLKKFNALSAGRQKEHIVSWANDQKREFARTREEFRQQHANDSLALKEEEAELKRGERQDAVADRWTRFGIGRDDKAMRDARKEEIQAFDMARRQGNWEDMRNDRLSIGERWQALKERDLGDRNARNTENLAARQKRYEEIDRRIIERRGTKDSPIKMGVKEAAENRRLGGLDATEQAGLEAIDRAVPLTPGGGEGTMEERRARNVETAQGPVRAQAGFMRIPEAKREPTVEDVKAIDEHIMSRMPEPEKATDRMWIRRIATDISAAGGAKMPNNEAAEFVLAAVDPKSPDPTVLRDGTVQLRPGLPPVQMTGESLMALAQLRARAQSTVFAKSNREQERRTSRGPAIPLTPLGTAEDRTARAQNRRRAIELMGTR